MKSPEEELAEQVKRSGPAVDMSEFISKKKAKTDYDNALRQALEEKDLQFKQQTEENYQTGFRVRERLREELAEAEEKRQADRLALQEELAEAKEAAREEKSLALF